MSNKVKNINDRHARIQLYERKGNAGDVCDRFGISRPTLRKWWRRFQEEGERGLRL